MKVKVLAVGGKMPAWVTEACQSYQKRLPPQLNPTVIEIPLGPRGKSTDLHKAIAQEGQQMLAALPAADRVIALDVKGSNWSTEDLAQNILDWQMAGDNISFLIGGPDGLATDCMQRAQSRWSLSALTLPHPLVRVILMEQLYRAWSINSSHPYHRQ